jgi:hypothetical protein
MSSKAKKRKNIKKWKKTANKSNLKADRKRIENNLEILRDLASKDGS